MNQSTPLVTLSDVSYATPDGRALGKDINCELQCGEVLLITGPNGSGKSTLLDIILGKRPCNSGTVQCNLPAASISYLPQLQDTETHMPFSLRDVVTAQKAVVDDEIVALGLLEKTHLKLSWNSASGGEKRRTLLTRTLLAEPELLVLDEPFNHLDSDSRGVMLSSIQHFVSVMSRSVVLSTHEGFADDTLGLTIKHVAL